MIDAVSGEIVESFNRIHNQSVPGEAHCRYHGVQTISVDSTAPTSFRLRDDTRGGGVETRRRKRVPDPENYSVPVQCSVRLDE